MRLIFSLIVLAAAAYLAYTLFVQPGGAFYKRTHYDSQVDTTLSTETGSVTATPAPERSVSFAPPGFRSQIRIPVFVPPGEKPTAPPGVYYITKRVSVQTRDGVLAIVPGEPLKLLHRPGNGTVKLTTGEHDFVVKESNVTTDLQKAQEAEIKDYASRLLQR